MLTENRVCLGDDELCFTDAVLQDLTLITADDTRLGFTATLVTQGEGVVTQGRNRILPAAQRQVIRRTNQGEGS